MKADHLIFDTMMKVHVSKLEDKSKKDIGLTIFRGMIGGKLCKYVKCVLVV
jgi:hypothetical protein